MPFKSERNFPGSGCARPTEISTEIIESPKHKTTDTIIIRTRLILEFLVSINSNDKVNISYLLLLVDETNTGWFYSLSRFINEEYAMRGMLGI
jgi:hypothetical protein